jgi:predicted transcriptional regulator
LYPGTRGGIDQGIHNDREPCTSFAVKELLREAFEQLPEDATVEDAMDRLYFLAKVARGLEAADRGEVVSHQQVRSVIPGDDEDDAR